MRVIITTLALGAMTTAFAGGHKRISKQEYVDQWSGVAVEQMVDNGIPASITLAQGILESANGNSSLATEGNNHFGIKCHGWEGKKMYKDDDREDECFRVYTYAEDSYRDHSEFLMRYKRYEFLFEYDSDDYKSWAKGLRTAGYATNPKYSQLLIDIIEDLKLYEYDAMTKTILHPESPIVMEIKISEMQSNTHLVKIHEKGVKFIIAQEGDTFYKIAKEFGLTLRQLRRFNDLDKNKDVLEAGDVLFIQAKKRRNWFKKEEVVVTETMSINELSQLYATNAISIRRLNNYSEDIEDIAKGEKVTLR
ncbi:MAG: glucosaminidase domain-containing protein [Crocinitomicaceae bacterium]|nr:glucosaminidase domain-containing protein [Crocinitomicaceae bacterium]